MGLRAHLRSNLIGYLALFCSLGLGTAWAATGLTANSVKSFHIAKGQVKRSDIARNAVNSQRVADGSVRPADLAPGTIPAADTPAAVLAKITQVDGERSELDADRLDGRDSSSFSQIVHEASVPWNPSPLAADSCTVQSITLPAAVQASDHLVVTPDVPSGWLTTLQLTGTLFKPGDVAFAVLCADGGTDPPAFNVNVQVLR